jgi:hypothetical protein
VVPVAVAARLAGLGRLQKQVTVPEVVVNLVG